MWCILWQAFIHHLWSARILMSHQRIARGALDHCVRPEVRGDPDGGPRLYALHGLCFVEGFFDNGEAFHRRQAVMVDIIFLQAQLRARLHTGRAGERYFTRTAAARAVNTGHICHW